MVTRSACGPPVSTPAPTTIPARDRWGACSPPCAWPGQPVVVVLSCDMPVIDGPTVARLVGALAADPAAQVAAPVIDGLAQGITAAYRGDAAPVLADAFDGGERAVRRAIRSLRLAPVVGVDPARLVDVDRPDDLRRYAAPS